ncbi:uncharacterized [Tachysurus ichikawai]
MGSGVGRVPRFSFYSPNMAEQEHALGSVKEKHAFSPSRRSQLMILPLHQSRSACLYLHTVPVTCHANG